MFRDQTNRYWLGSVSTPFTGFGSEWFDFDNGGRLDLFVAAGGVTIMVQQRGAPYPFRQTNQLFHAAQGRFEGVSERAGGYFSFAEVSRGAAFGDIDNDGDVDIAVSKEQPACSASSCSTASAEAATVGETQLVGERRWVPIRACDSQLAGQNQAHADLWLGESLGYVPKGELRSLASLSGLKKPVAKSAV